MRELAEFRAFAPTRSRSCKENVSRSMIARSFVISVRLKHRRSRVQADQKDRKHQILLPSGRIFSAIGRMISDWRCDCASRRRKRRTYRSRAFRPRSAGAFRADFGRLNRVASAGNRRPQRPPRLALGSTVPRTPPLPPCGEGMGVGVRRRGAAVPHRTTPHPIPPPTRGRESPGATPSLNLTPMRVASTRSIVLFKTPPTSA